MVNMLYVRSSYVLCILCNLERVSSIQTFCFAAEYCLCISAILRLYFMYVNQKLSCKMGSNIVFLNVWILKLFLCLSKMTQSTTSTFSNFEKDPYFPQKMKNNSPTRGGLNINMLSYQWRNSHYKDMMISRPCIIYNGNLCTLKDGPYIKTVLRWWSGTSWPSR